MALERRKREPVLQAAPRYDGPERRLPHLPPQLWGIRRHPLRLAPAPWPQGQFVVDPEA